MNDNTATIIQKKSFFSFLLLSFFKLLLGVTMIKPPYFKR
jgi:hypothetical protein